MSGSGGGSPGSGSFFGGETKKTVVENNLIVNVISHTEEDIKALEDKYYGPGGELRDLAHLRGIGNAVDFDVEPKGFTHQGRQEIFHHHTYDLIRRKDEEIQQLTVKITNLEAKEAELMSWYTRAMDEVLDLRGKKYNLEQELHQQRFNNKHNLSIDQKIADEIEKLKNHNTVLGLKVTVAETALECIENPTKMNHKERDDKTQLYCLQNVAHVALKVMRGEHVDV